VNYYPVTVVDNFYENPDEVRSFALAQEYKFCHEIKNINYTFPGSRTEDLSVIHPELMQKCCLKLTSLFHNFDHDAMRWQITSCFQSVTKEYERGVIHHDNNTVFAGVLYLAPNAPQSSGTTLYKTGKDFDQEVYQRALLANDERFKMNQPVDTSYHGMFDEIVRLKMSTTPSFSMRVTTTMQPMNSSERQERHQGSHKFFSATASIVLAIALSLSVALKRFTFKFFFFDTKKTATRGLPFKVKTIQTSLRRIRFHLETLFCFCFLHQLGF